jgi:CDP-glycerol glycerophosphotransferase
MIDDLNPLLKDIDVLITDYSGAYFDFLLTGNPIILAPFDFKEYLSESRELYFDYYRDIVGVKCDDWNEILSTLKKGNIHLSVNKNVRQFNSFFDGDSSKRLVEEILKL